MTYRLKVPKDYRRLVRAAEDAGWTLSLTGKGHPKLTSPDGSYATPIPSSSGARALHKSITLRLRSHGVDV